MGWIIMGAILFILLNKSGRCGSRRRYQRPRHSRRQDASDVYRMEAQMEDMSRRMRSMERANRRRDDRLRREFRDL